MSGGLLNMRTHCRNCLAALTLDEMHYLDSGDGSATCSACETQWSQDMMTWRTLNNGSKPPERP